MKGRLHKMRAVFETVEVRKVECRQIEDGMSNKRILESCLWKDTLIESPEARKVEEFGAGGHGLVMHQGQGIYSPYKWQVPMPEVGQPRAMSDTRMRYHDGRKTGISVSPRCIAQ